MADLFVDDGGSNTSPYETWAKAATTFATAVSASSAGDDIILGHDHSEALGGNTTYTFPGTSAAPNRVISCTSSAGGSTKTYNKADNIQIDSSGGVRDITLVGHVKFYGVSLKTGDDLIFTTLATTVWFDDSVIELSSAGALFLLTAGQVSVFLKNTDVNFSGGAAAAAFKLLSGSNLFEWHGGTVSWAGTQPTALFNNSKFAPIVSVAGVDLNAITSALVDVSDLAVYLATFHHCLINSGVSLITGTIALAGTKVLMSGCDDTTGNDLYRLEYVDYYGSIVHDDSIYYDSGASDGTTNISWKFVTTANATEFSEPLISPPIVVWVDSTGSKTFTVQINWDSATNVQNDEIWLEVEYLEASADTDSAFANDGMADIFATPADQATNAESWTGTGGFTNENQQALAVTATVNRVGPVICRVHMGKPSTTIYVDPKVTVT